MSLTIELIAAEIGEGAQEIGCKQGPQALRSRGLAQSLSRDGHVAVWGQTVTSDETLACNGKLAVVESFSPDLASAVLSAMGRQHFPLILGGDHSSAIGTWSAVAQAHHDRGDIGLIWIDAHLDSHTPDTSESQAPHGMPLAALLGHGSERLISLFGWTGKIKPQNVVVIGARSYEAGEAALLQSVGVRVMDVAEVKVRGMVACMAEAIRMVSAGTIGYGVTFDVDAIDPQDAPGVGSPVDDGIRVNQALAGLSLIADDERLLAFELVEYNPELDDAQRTTATVCERLITAALTSAGSLSGIKSDSIAMAA
jgi:arginase